METKYDNELKRYIEYVKKKYNVNYISGYWSSNLSETTYEHIIILFPN